MGYRKCMICGDYFDDEDGYCEDGYKTSVDLNPYIGHARRVGVFCSYTCYQEWYDRKEARKQAAEAAEAAERRVAAEAERRRKEEEHERMLARCVNIDGAYYSQDKTTLIEVDKMTRRLVVPEGVVEIGKNACYECKSLKSVTLPESLEEIGEAAFCYCSALTSVTIPKNVKKIGKWAFSGSDETPSGLEEVTIEDGCSVIGRVCFNTALRLNQFSFMQA